MISELQYQAMRAYRTHFLDTGEVHESVRPMVADSWKRSLASGVNPSRDAGSAAAIQRLSEREVERLLGHHRELLAVARPIMMRAVDYIEGSQYAVTLHDKDGRILCHLFAGDNTGFYASSPGFNIGAVWGESTVGTCAPFLCTLLDQDIQLMGYEHFSENLCDLACTAAPIHAEDGEVIACFNVIGRCEKLTPHTLVFVKSIALLIQAHLNLKTNNRMIKDVFNMMSDGLVVLDEGFKVRQVSFQAASALRAPQESLYTLDFRKLFKKEDFEDRIERETTPFNYPEYDLMIGDRSVTCNVTIAPILKAEHFGGAIITLRETRQINRMVNQVSGNQARYGFDDILTGDNEMRALIRMMKNVANTAHCVLIEGESGTGKELFAHALHNESNRRNEPFIAVNCASLPRSLVESELFGYEKGAFTGARSGGSPGKFELADGGTIFLDEIGELPLEIQATLLRVLDNHRIIRIGGKTEKTLDVRVIAATNRNLYKEVQNGNFRSDLYFRINVLKYDIPPLRERAGDIRFLAEVFLSQMNDNNAQGIKAFSEECYDVLMRYSWPGNIRELQNIVARGFYASGGNEIGLSELPPHILDEVSRHDLPTDSANGAEAHSHELKEFERQRIVDALIKCSGNAVKAGELLGYSKSTIYRRIQEYNIALK